METPLDMLSRAATMIQTEEHSREVAMKRQIDERASPPKDLPTKTQKLQRMHDRQQLSGLLNYDQHHSDRCNTNGRNSATNSSNNNNSNTLKCAGTQTPFSSFGHEGPPPYVHQPQSPYQASPGVLMPYMDVAPQEERYILDLDKVHSHPPHMPPAGGAHQASFSLSNHNTSEAESDSSNMPLNLTVSSSLSSSTATVDSQHRPSVITCATVNPRPSNVSPAATASSHVFSLPPGGAMAPTAGTGNNKRASVEPCDPVIEEHFRRSLGAYYAGGRNFANAQVAPPVSVPPPQQSRPSPPQGAMTNGTLKHDNAVSVTGSVDDHFAKSLGDMWTKIKAGNDAKNGELKPDPVDDHFAKALGQQTWDRIRNEKESQGRSSASPVSAGSPASPPQEQSWYHEKAEKVVNEVRYSPVSAGPPTSPPQEQSWYHAKAERVVNEALSTSPVPGSPAKSATPPPAQEQSWNDAKAERVMNEALNTSAARGSPAKSATPPPPQEQSWYHAKAERVVNEALRTSPVPGSPAMSGSPNISGAVHV